MTDSARKHVGDIVHVNSGTQCWAAIVTDVLDNDAVHLTVFPPNITPYPMRAVPYGSPPSHWHWLFDEGHA